MLYTKYRSQKFSDLVGQDVITQTLRNAVSENRLTHAYIFSGPRGTGKTSTARILAKAVNCPNHKKGEPCNDCAVCNQITEGTAIDVIEIDAASHTSVDDIRDLIEKVNFSPVSFEKKVYIIDEVHMLSRSAFNALLKTLEEPPEHVLFILATTEIHKVPVTVLSRCQRFDFRLGSDKEIFEVLNQIVKKEKIIFEDGALDYVVDIAQGSYRDAISTVERIFSKEGLTKDNKITSDEVRSLLGIPDKQKFELLYKFLIEKKLQESLDLINSVVESGEDVKIFSSYFLKFLRYKLIDQIETSGLASSVLFKMIKEFGVADKDLTKSPVVQLPLELAAIKVMDSMVGDVVSLIRKEENEIPNQKEENTLKKKIKKNRKIKNENAKKRCGDKKIGKGKGDREANGSSYDCSEEQIRNSWQEYIDTAKPYNGHLYAFISKSEVDSYDKDKCVLKLSVPYEFYKERIEDVKSREILTEVANKVYGVNLTVNCVVKKCEEKEVDDSEVFNEESSAEIMDVFGEDVV